MKKSLNNFLAQQLPLATSESVKGGQSFCDWYLNHCDKGKDKFEPQVLGALAYWDGVYTNGHWLTNKQFKDYIQTLEDFYGIVN